MTEQQEQRPIEPGASTEPPLHSEVGVAAREAAWAEFYNGNMDEAVYDRIYESLIEAEARAGAASTEATPPTGPVYLYWSEYDDSATVKGWGGDNIYKCRECPEWEGDSYSAPRHSALHRRASTEATERPDLPSGSSERRFLLALVDNLYGGAEKPDDLPTRLLAIADALDRVDDATDAYCAERKPEQGHTVDRGFQADIRAAAAALTGASPSEPSRERPRCLRCGATWEHRDDYAGLGTPHRFEPTGAAPEEEREPPEAQKSTADLALQRSKSRHAAWCFLPADHDGACDGDQ